MTGRSCESECAKQGRLQERTKNEIDESRFKKKCKVIEKETRTERLMPLFAASILEIEKLNGLPICNGFIDILRDPEFNLNLLTTRIKDVDGWRAIQESVVCRGVQECFSIFSALKDRHGKKGK